MYMYLYEILVLFIQRAVLKFAKYTGAVAVAGRFTPGTFTNQIQKAFREPRLLVVSDPITDHQVRSNQIYLQCRYSYMYFSLSSEGKERFSAIPTP